MLLPLSRINDFPDKVAVAKMRDGMRGQSVFEFILLFLLLGLVALAVWATLNGGPAKAIPKLERTWNRG